MTAASGTGRFEWKSYTPGGKIVLTKYADYRDAENTHLDTIQIDVIGDPTALVSAVRSGRAQYAVGVPPVDARSLSQQPGFERVTTGGSAFPIAFDVTKPPFDNKIARQAVQYAIDRDRIVEQAEAVRARPRACRGGRRPSGTTPRRPGTTPTTRTRPSSCWPRLA